MAKSQTNQQRTRRLIRELARLYPDAECSLNFETPVQLLVATILSAQCTDARVNMVTPELFRRFPDAAAMASANSNEIQTLIKSTGFYQNKTRSILACSQALVEKYGGKVPQKMEELVQLGGVGRKTANVILGNAFGIPGLPVDTHVSRLSKRLGLTTNNQATNIERDLCTVIPKKEWTLFSLRLIYHGRQVCHARKPRCQSCALVSLCPRVGVDTGQKEVTEMNSVPLLSSSSKASSRKKPK